MGGDGTEDRDRDRDQDRDRNRPTGRPGDYLPSSGGGAYRPGKHIFLSLLHSVLMFYVVA